MIFRTSNPKIIPPTYASAYVVPVCFFAIASARAATAATQKITKKGTDSLLPFPLSLAAQKPKKILSNPLLLDDNEISEYLSAHKYSFSNTNVCSLQKNYEIVKDLAADLKTSFIILTEIWQIDPKYYKIPNYHEASVTIRDKKRGGGVAIFSSVDFPSPKPYEVLNKIYKSIEVIAIETIIDKSSFIIVGIYKPPDKSFSIFLKELRNILQILIKSDKKFLISGDFNVNLLDQNQNSTSYLDILDEFQVKQLVKGPTRITSRSKTNLDHFLTNVDFISAYPTHHRIADHQTVVAAYKEIKKNLYKGKNSNSKQNSQKIILDEENSVNNINNYNWTSWIEKHENSNVNEASENLTKVLEDLMIFKEIKSRKKRPKKPWYTFELMKQKSELDKKRKTFLKDSSEKNEKDLSIVKKAYNDNLKIAERKYYAEKIEKAGSNSKAIWAIINESLSRKKKNFITTKKIIYEGKEYSDDFDIAQIFNSHFKQAAHNISSKIQAGPDFRKYLFKDPECSSKMDFKETNSTETFKIINSLSNKKSSGFDKISSSLIKKCSHSISSPITFLINLSFSEGIFPKNLKIGKLTPLHKRDERTNVANFRPISQLSCISTIIEKTIKQQMNNHFIEQNVISKFQSGFRGSHGTLHSLISTRAIIEKELQQKKFICLVSFDQEKAFDLIDCEKILPEKFSYYGMSSKATAYLKSFFNSRKQYVSFNKTNSELIDLHNISVTQGSTLGPSSFNIYVNDLPSVSNGCSTIMFADDSSFIFSSKTIPELSKKVNEELVSILAYMQANKLSVNISKCKFMVFKPIGKKKSIEKMSVSLNGHNLEEVTNLKFLGCFLDNNLSFNTHINHVISKLRSGISALKLTRNILSYRCKKMIYNSLFKSHLDYCAILWHDKLNKTQTALITRLQKKAIRLIFSARWNVHTAKLFSISKIIPVERIFHNESILFLKKHQNNELPEIFTDFLGPPELYLQSEKQITKYRMQKTEYKIEMPKVYKKGHIFYNVISEWNNSDEETRAPSKVKATKFRLKKLSKEKLDKFICQKTQCYMCNLDRFRDYEKYTKY